MNSLIIVSDAKVLLEVIKVFGFSKDSTLMKPLILSQFVNFQLTRESSVSILHIIVSSPMLVFLLLIVK